MRPCISCPIGCVWFDQSNNLDFPKWHIIMYQIPWCHFKLWRYVPEVELWFCKIFHHGFCKSDWIYYIYTGCQSWDGKYQRYIFVISHQNHILEWSILWFKVIWTIEDATDYLFSFSWKNIINRYGWSKLSELWMRLIILFLSLRTTVNMCRW